MTDSAISLISKDWNHQPDGYPNHLGHYVYLQLDRDQNNETITDNKK